MSEALDPAAVLPHLMQLGTVLNRSQLVERAMEAARTRGAVKLDRPITKPPEAAPQPPRNTSSDFGTWCPQE